MNRDIRGTSNEVDRIYAEAGIKFGQELRVSFMDLFSALYEEPGVFLDGMLLTTKGSEILFNKIEKVIKEANWEPSLDWDKMSTKFACIGTDMHLEMLIKEIEDKTTEITDSDVIFLFTVF
ncbi:hypothetical protein T459_27149 [Capsicum annuum]|uniref:Uncharacterized protein n=1 Tax=Capsicum annuum TaxID=4072 RepID=A0A2G2YD41_CAPAN|nr:hypothetical protein T459_27149 [Capsicum annuum]